MARPYEVGEVRTVGLDVSVDGMSIVPPGYLGEPAARLLGRPFELVNDGAKIFRVASDPAAFPHASDVELEITPEADRVRLTWTDPFGTKAAAVSWSTYVNAIGRFARSIAAQTVEVRAAAAVWFGVEPDSIGSANLKLVYVLPHPLKSGGLEIFLEDPLGQYDIVLDVTTSINAPMAASADAVTILSQWDDLASSVRYNDRQGLGPPPFLQPSWTAMSANL